MRRANGRSQRRFSNGERRIATDGRGRSSSVPGGTRTSAPVLDAEPLELAVLDERGDRGANARGAALEPPVLDDPALRERPAGVHGTEREHAQALRLRRRRASRTAAGRTRSGRRRAAGTPVVRRRRGRRGSRGARASASPASSPISPWRAAPSKCREPSGPRADLLEDVLAEVRMRSVHLSVPPASAVVHGGPEERPVGGRREACLVGPVLDQAAAPEQARDRVAGIRADARADRDRWLRSTVEMESSCTHEAADDGLDLRGGAAPVPRRVPLRVDRDSPHGRHRHAHPPGSTRRRPMRVAPCPRAPLPRGLRSRARGCLGAGRPRPDERRGRAPNDADAVFVLAGSNGSIPEGQALVGGGIAPTLVVSSDKNTRDAARNRLCRNPPEGVECIVRGPFATGGELQALAGSRAIVAGTTSSSSRRAT